MLQLITFVSLDRQLRNRRPYYFRIYVYVTDLLGLIFTELKLPTQSRFLTPTVYQFCRIKSIVRVLFWQSKQSSNFVLFEGTTYLFTYNERQPWINFSIKLEVVVIVFNFLFKIIYIDEWS